MTALLAAALALGCADEREQRGDEEVERATTSRPETPGGGGGGASGQGDPTGTLNLRVVALAEVFGSERAAAAGQLSGVTQEVVAVGLRAAADSASWRMYPVASEVSWLVTQEEPFASLQVPPGSYPWVAVQVATTATHQRVGCAAQTVVYERLSDPLWLVGTQVAEALTLGQDVASPLADDWRPAAEFDPATLIGAPAADFYWILAQPVVVTANAITEVLLGAMPRRSYHEPGLCRENPGLPALLGGSEDQLRVTLPEVNLAALDNDSLLGATPQVLGHCQGAASCADFRQYGSLPETFAAEQACVLDGGEWVAGEACDVAPQTTGCRVVDADGLWERWPTVSGAQDCADGQVVTTPEVDVEG